MLRKKKWTTNFKTCAKPEHAKALQHYQKGHTRRRQPERKEVNKALQIPEIYPK